MNKKHNSPAIRAFRKEFVSVAGPDSQIMSDGTIGEMFSMILESLCRDPEELRERGKEPVSSWDNVRTMVDEAVKVYLNEEYEEIRGDVKKLLNEAIDRAEQKVGEFQRPQT